MKQVVVPTSDVNSEHGVVVAWFAENRARVEADAVLAEVETSKSVLEVVAPDGGYLLHLAGQGAELALSAPIALLFEDEAALKAYEEEAARPPTGADQDSAPTARATVKAVARAGELGIDLSTFDGSRLVTVKDVEAAAARRETAVDPARLPVPLVAEPGVQRLVIIGGGLGATQVVDILRDVPGQRAVAVLDDSRAKWGGDVYGVPVVGGVDRLAALFTEGRYDAAVIAISRSVETRRALRQACQDAGIALANVIDRTAKLAADVVIGTGNVICAFCHFGTGTRIGDNNFISAYNSYDHHNVLASDISTGPGCLTSGRVRVGNRVRLGTGIHVEPGVELGDGVQVASGAVIVRSVPADHAVKTKVVTTTVVPHTR